MSCRYELFNKDIVELSTALNQPVLEGYLVKEGHLRKSWRRRFFSIDMQSGILTYYIDHSKGKMKGRYRIDPSTSSVDDYLGQWKTSINTELCFIVEANRVTGSGVEKKTEKLLLQARTVKSKKVWMGYINEIIGNSNKI